MDSIKNQFIPYELALKLKELGFDEECFGVYVNGNFEPRYRSKNSKFNPNGKLDKRDLEFCTALLWGQAFDWFREEKGLLNHLTTHLNTWGEDSSLETSFGYRIMIDKDGWKCDVWEQLSRYETYEEARQACLEKLITLCKNN